MKKRTAGFSLIEIAIVVLVIGILAAIAVPLFQQATRRSLLSTLENDLRVMSQQFLSYELEFGEYPPSELDSGVFPTGMDNRLTRAWLDPCVAGGFYRWNYTTEDNPLDRAAYIDVVGTPDRPILLGTNELKKLDHELDNGDETTGKLRVYGMNIRYYVRLPKGQ
ncbi:MAG: type II secretion system protein [Coraliomargarita sp.]